ncbi:hypothetical protein A2U01_0107087, partial [Trifolium medium]|nr:hypothetical protein [Trifolium medium]
MVEEEHVGEGVDPATEGVEPPIPEGNLHTNFEQVIEQDQEMFQE